MSKQEVFDEVVAHIRRQGKPSITLTGRCVYRAPDGSQCAIGALMPDELYAKVMEGEGISQFSDHKKGKRRKFWEMLADRVGSRSFETTNFLAALQSMHDAPARRTKGNNIMFLERFEENAKYVALRHNLVYTPPEEKADA